MLDYRMVCFFGAFFIVSGYLIWFKKKHFLIAGFRDGKWYGKEVNVQRLARFFGLYQICTGVTLFAGALLFHWLDAPLGTVCTLTALIFTYRNLRRIEDEFREK
ncbi:MAG TPA: DUF3784 domain-containing protein [Bacillales bacterium]|nr:DUF3784 domain-containing protein [Bacillales bacterium]